MGDPNTHYTLVAVESNGTMGVTRNREGGESSSVPGLFSKHGKERCIAAVVVVAASSKYIYLAGLDS
jgi:hypothetical protein